MSSVPYGMNINTLTPADVESVPCPVCGAKGQCVDLHTPMHVKRNDYHSERKYAALTEKQQQRELIRQQAIRAEFSAQLDAVMTALEVKDAQMQAQKAEVVDGPAEMSPDVAEDAGGPVPEVSGEDGGALPPPEVHEGEQ